MVVESSLCCHLLVGIANMYVITRVDLTVFIMS